MQYSYAKFQGYAQQSQSNWQTLFPWKTWPSQSQSQNQSWKQGWEEPYRGNPPYTQHCPHQYQFHPYHSPPPQHQFHPHLISNQPFPLPRTQTPQRSIPTPLPAQPFQIPNNKTPQSTYNVEVLQNNSSTAIEEQQPEEEDSDKVQESWMPVDKEQLLEPEIEKFHVFLSPDSMNGDHISKNLHGMIEGSQGRQDYIESWFKQSLDPSIPFFSVF